MAVVAVEVAAEAAQGFEATSAAEAGTEGLDVDQIAKSFGQIIGLISAVDDLIRAFKSGKHNEEHEKRKRRLAGIVLEGEKRGPLILEGEIPAYYSKSNINNILLHNKLPFGWSKETTIFQGFGRGIRNGEFRQKLQNESEGIINALKLDRRTKTTVNNFNRIVQKLRTERRLEELRSTLV